MTWLVKNLGSLLLGILLALAATWSWHAGLNPYWPVICVAFAGISLLRSYKAFVEVWRSRISKWVDIEVAAEKDTYLPGNVINVCVRVMRKEEPGIEEARVALVCTNRYVYHYARPDSNENQVYRTKEVTEEVEAGDERVHEEKTILPGS